MHELNMLVFLLCTQIFVEVNKSKIDGHIEFLHELAMLQNACFVFYLLLLKVMNVGGAKAINFRHCF